VTFSNLGGEKFAEITKSIAGTNQLLAIILDGESISEAVLVISLLVLGLQVDQQQ